MFYALTRLPLVRLMLIAAVPMLVAITTYAATASNTTTAPNVGGGSEAIAGFTVTNVQFDLNTADPSNIDSVSFSVAPTAREAHVKLNAGTARGCTTSDGGTTWSCDLSADTTTAVALTSFEVLASS